MMLTPDTKAVTAAWGALAVFVLMAALGLRAVAPSFAYEAPFEDMPILGFVGAYVLAALTLCICLPALINKTPQRTARRVLILILLVGVMARLTQFGAPSLLEDDFYRYLWDGAVVAIGENPFRHAPLDVLENGAGPPALQALAQQGQLELSRINHPEYRTIYPPVLQAVFALSHVAAPFDLDGWRAVLLVFEMGIAAAICAILVHLGRSALWVVLYWWNPLVIKEVANSAHMEPVLMLPVLVAAYLVLRNRLVWGTGLLALAAGVKLWPVILAAAIWRNLLGQPRHLVTSMLLTGTILALVFWPVLTSQLDDSSGFVAFAKSWKASSAVILVSEWTLGTLTHTAQVAPLAARGLLGLALLATIAAVCRRAADRPAEMLRRMFLIAAALYLLSPSQTPWYFLWVAPFLCFFPVRGLLLAGALLPLHYLYFHFALLEQEALYRYSVVWLIWLPVWAVLLFDAIRPARRALRQGGTV